MEDNEHSEMEDNEYFEMEDNEYNEMEDNEYNEMEDNESFKMEDNEDVEMDINGDYPMSETERRRLKNIAELAAFIAEEENSEESLKLKAEIDALTVQINATRRAKPTRRRENPKRDHSFRFSGQIPTERRRSARLAKLPPDSNPSSENDAEEETSKASPPKKKRKSTRRSRASAVPVLHVEDVTKEMLNNIATFSTRKTYCPETGTTCHQCRQKTLDTKTVCRSGQCKGLRGYFCGSCLRNRYGESAAEALLTPNWVCPVCRDLCNCSFCNIANGKPPTGVLAPMAIQQGYKSVSHFLQDLDKQGILPGGKVVNEDNEPCLLGFKENGEYVLT